MPRSGTLIGSIKSLFKPTKNGSQKSGTSLTANVPHATMGPVSGDTSDSLPPFSDVFSSQAALASESAKDEGMATSSPWQSFSRSRNSNSFSPSRIPLNVSEAAVCHSLSDPCDDVKPDNCQRSHNSGVCDVPARRNDVVRLPPKTSSLLMDTRGVSPLMTSAESTPAATADNARRCLSLDIPASSLTSPAVFGKQQPLLHAVLASKDPSAHTRSPEVLHSKSMIVSLDMLQPAPPDPPAPARAAPPPAAPAAPSVPKSTLLALCPGVPAAMRRGHWSVEDYEVTRRIYKGASSTVYKATCRQSDMPVALKVYFLSKVPKNVVHMIVREIKIHIDLVHKNVVMLYAAFQNRLVLVQEYAGRGDLYGIYRSLNRRMTEAQLKCLVLRPFMEALSYLHSRGVCHRDIKPENILYTTDWRLIVADFGVSIDLNEERAVTRAGTLEYMAPEVERCPLKMLPEENKDKDDLAYTTAVDIWAVGVLAYELLVGFPPFVGDRMAVATGSVDVRSSVRQALTFPAGTSRDAKDFISRALAEAPEERPTAVELGRHPWLAAAAAVPQQGVRV